MGYKTTHKENLVALKRIEGQVKGIQKMIEENNHEITKAWKKYFKS